MGFQSFLWLFFIIVQLINGAIRNAVSVDSIFVYSDLPWNFFLPTFLSDYLQLRRRCVLMPLEWFVRGQTRSVEVPGWNIWSPPANYRVLHKPFAAEEWTGQSTGDKSREVLAHKLTIKYHQSCFCWSEQHTAAVGTCCKKSEKNFIRMDMFLQYIPLQLK